VQIIRQLIFDAFRYRKIRAGQGLLVQVIRTHVFKLADFKQNPTIGNDLTVELNNLISEGILDISDNNENFYILTEEGEKII